MKIQLTALLLVMAALFLFGCGDEDSDSGTNQAPEGDDDADIEDDDNDDNDDATDDDATDDDDDDDTGPEPLSILFSFPPVAPAGQDYQFQFEATGGTPPYHGWQVSNGELPEGWDLDGETGLLTGQAAEEEELYYFVVDVQDSAKDPATARESFGIRVGDPQLQGPLLQKAQAYQAIYDLRHNSDGLSVTADNPDDSGGDYWFSDLGDACFIHGNSSAGAAFRYAVEQSQDALSNVELHVRGLDLLNRVNGVPGLLSRSYMPKDGPMAPNEFQTFWPESENHEGEGEFVDYYWKGDVSIDQYSGALVGLAWTYDLVPDETVRATVRGTITEIADYLWAGDMLIYDVDGEPTRYGHFRGWWLEGYPVPNGLGAAAALAWFKLAWLVSGEQRFADRYQELIAVRHYEVSVENFLWVYYGYMTKHYNVYMAFENMATLTRLEDDPYLKNLYTESFTRWLWESSGDSLRWRRARVEANPTFTPWYLFATGKKDPDAIMNSIWQMDVFVDPPLRDRYIENSANPDIEKNPENPTDALYPLPADLRIPDMCIWHRSPYHLDGGENNGRERTGHDYLLPYWMGRYYGYISPDW